jgi:hypothetical protein
VQSTHQCELSIASLLLFSVSPVVGEYFLFGLGENRAVVRPHELSLFSTWIVFVFGLEGRKMRGLKDSACLVPE